MYSKYGITIKELKEFLESFPDDSDGEVWMYTDTNISNVCVGLYGLNGNKDMILEPDGLSTLRREDWIPPRNVSQSYSGKGKAGGK